MAFPAVVWPDFGLPDFDVEVADRVRLGLAEAGMESDSRKIEVKWLKKPQNFRTC